MSRTVGSKTLEAGLRVVDALYTGGDLLEWKTLEQIAARAQVSRNVAYAALNTLTARGWAEKGERGWRSNGGLVRYWVAANEALASTAQQLGLRS